MRPPGLDSAAKKARNILSDGSKTVEVLNQAMDKAQKQRGRISKAWYELEMLFRMVKAWTRGEYRNIPTKTIVSALAAIIYFLSPFDIIPDFLLGLGFSTMPQSLFLYLIPSGRISKNSLHGMKRKIRNRPLILAKTF